jgi:hypothetical protein
LDAIVAFVNNVACVIPLASLMVTTSDDVIIDVRIYTYSKSRMTGRILIKFCVDVMLLVSSPRSCFSSSIININVTECQIRDAGGV